MSNPSTARYAGPGECAPRYGDYVSPPSAPQTAAISNNEDRGGGEPIIHVFDGELPSRDLETALLGHPQNSDPRYGVASLPTPADVTR